MEKMVRVLHIFHNMGNGGIENFVMNYYRAIDRDKIQFDFLTSVEKWVDIFIMHILKRKIQ